VGLTTGVKIPEIRFQNDEGERERVRFLKYVAPSPGTVKRVRKLLRSTLVIAPMGFGKTSFIEAKLGDAVSYLLDKGVDDDEIAYVYAQEVSLQTVLEKLSELDLSRYTYLFIFMDDVIAAEGMHGRRAMSRENVEQTKALVMVRHRLENLGYTGYTHIVWTAQVYTLVDVSVRRTSTLKIFKDYPEEPGDFWVLSRMLGAAALAALNKISDMVASDDPLKILMGLYSGVAVMKRYRWMIQAFDGAGSVEEIEGQVERKKRVLHGVRRLVVGPDDYMEYSSVRRRLDAAMKLLEAVAGLIDDVRCGKRFCRLVVLPGAPQVKREVVEALGLIKE